MCDKISASLLELSYVFTKIVFNECEINGNLQS